MQIINRLLEEKQFQDHVKKSPCEFQQGSLIIKKGTLNQEFYIIKEGTVKVMINEIGSSLPAITLGANESIGEYALFDNLEASADVIVETNVKLIKIDIPSLRVFLEKNTSIGYKVCLEFLRTLIRRLRSSNELLNNFYGSQ